MSFGHAKHVVKDIEHQDGLKSPGKFAERGFLGHALHRQAIVSEFLDVHLLRYFSGRNRESVFFPLDDSAF